jgi:hypothetical protein
VRISTLLIESQGTATPPIATHTDPVVPHNQQTGLTAKTARPTTLTNRANRVS